MIHVSDGFRQTMKNIHNLLSDAFVAALLEEANYIIHIAHETSALCIITITDKQTEKVLRVRIVYESDGYIQNVNSDLNTMLATNHYSYSRFLNTIYNAEFVAF